MTLCMIDLISQLSISFNLSSLIIVSDTFVVHNESVCGFITDVWLCIKTLPLTCTDVLFMYINKTATILLGMQFGSLITIKKEVTIQDLVIVNHERFSASYKILICSYGQNSKWFPIFSMFPCLKCILFPITFINSFMKLPVHCIYIMKVFLTDICWKAYFKPIQGTI